jgi:hypothetical protein
MHLTRRQLDAGGCSRRRSRLEQLPAKKRSAEGEPALPVARSTISSTERSEASEGEIHQMSISIVFFIQ